MRVLMLPGLKKMTHEESGIRRVIEAYHRLGPQFGIEFVDVDVEDTSKYDLFVVHAGSSGKYPAERPIVAIIHGLYWTGDYAAETWERAVNANVISSLRLANTVAVPSAWVAESIARDMRISPIFVVPHGIVWDAWQHDYSDKGYVLWNKNRAYDVCFPEDVGRLAKLRTDIHFVSTFKPNDSPGNVEAIGVVPHAEMKNIVQGATVYLSTTKETFGIGVLEALASGVPVLGYAHGGNLIMVEHGINGYLAQPGNIYDLAQGLDYCVKHRNILSENARITAKKFTWENSMKALKKCFDYALAEWEKDKISLYIPSSSYDKRSAVHA